MPYKDPPIKNRFKKGAPSPNPLGARLHDPVKKALRRLTAETFKDVIELVIQGNVEALQTLIKNPDTPCLQVALAASFATAIKKGDYAIIEKMIERLIGKIPDVVHVTSQNVNQNINTKVDPKQIRTIVAKLNEEF